MIPSSALGVVMTSETGNMRKRWNELSKDVDSFKRSSAKIADDVDEATLPLRKTLVYRDIPGPDKTRFLRGVCFHGYSGLLVGDRSDKTSLKYSMFDFEYQAKALRGIGANLLYSDIYSHSVREKALSAFTRVGMPIAQVGRRNFNSSARDIRFSHYFNNHKELASDLRRWLKRWAKPYRTFWGVAADEPVIVSDFSSADLSLPDTPQMREMFKQRLLARKKTLDANKIDIPEKLDLKAIQKGEFGKAIWLELQYFMADFLAEHLQYLNNLCERSGVEFLPIVMSHNHYFPQECSYVSIGRTAKRLSTDLYNNGRLYEGFNLQLFRNAVDGTAWMTPGSGYSCKTPDRFRRSMAVSMLHSDGVLQWTNLYASKYRGPSYFWREKGGEELRSYWDWRYWGEMKDLFKRMKDADEWLSIRKTTNNVILLFSERQAIVNTFKIPRKYFVSKYFEENKTIYADLIRYGISADVGYVETAARKGLSQYNTAILSGAKTLTRKETACLRKWVAGGGTLIVSSTTASEDEWGRPLSSYSLSDVYGIEKKIGSVSSVIKKAGPKTKPFQIYLAKVQTLNTDPAKLVVANDDGTPLLLSHPFGKGKVLFFTPDRLSSIARISNQAGDVLPSKTGVLRFVLPTLEKCQKSQPIAVSCLPEGVETQIRKKGDAYVVHFLDWHDGRTVSGELSVNIPGRWRVFYPSGEKMSKSISGSQKYQLRKFRINDMLVVEPVK